MNCWYCSQPVLMGNPVTIAGIGPAHRQCYERSLIDQRIFHNLNLRQLPTEELQELSDMVKMEMNARTPQAAEIDLWD